MKKSIINITLVVVICFGSLYMIQYTAFSSVWVKKILNYFGDELYQAYHDAQKYYDEKIKVIVLGDSCGKQQFSNSDNNNPNVVSLTCNGAVSLAGQFIILNTFFENNSNQDSGTVLLMYHPVGFENNLDGKTTYHYVLKPFYTNKNKKHFTQYADSLIKQIPYYEFSQFPLIKMTEWSPTYDTGHEDNEILFLSRITIEYLKKISKICYEHGYSFKVVPPLMRPMFNGKEHYSLMREQIENNNLEKIFMGYFDSMIFISDLYFTDPVHLQSHFIKQVIDSTNFKESVYRYNI